MLYQLFCKNHTLTFQRCRKYIATEVPKVQWGGGGLKPYFTMIECSLYKENAPYYLFQKKKIILQQHSSRGAQGKLHLRFLINVLKERGDVKITPFLVYKKAAHFLQIPVLQAISAAS